MSKFNGTQVITLAATARVRTSEGVAAFCFPQVVEETIEVEVSPEIPARGKKPAVPAVVETRTETKLALTSLANDLGGKWVKLPKGSVVTVCAAYEKTDTWMLAVEIPASAVAEYIEKNTTKEHRPTLAAGQILGLVLRRMAFNTLCESGNVSEAQAVTVASSTETTGGEVPAADEGSEDNPIALIGDPVADSEATFQDAAADDAKEPTEEEPAANEVETVEVGEASLDELLGQDS